MSKLDQYQNDIMRLQRMISDRNDFINKLGLWQEFCNFRPNDEPPPKRKINNTRESIFKRIKYALINFYTWIPDREDVFEVFIITVYLFSMVFIGSLIFYLVK